jgi:prevent-host-death family protein
MKRTVSISELKARLSAFLDTVRQGEEVLVTDRGRIVARLAPVSGEELAEGRRELLVRTGRLTPPRAGLPPDFWERPRPGDTTGRSLEVLRAERESAG